MPRHRPIDREEPGEVIRSMKVKMRRDAHGNLVPVVPKKPPAPPSRAPDSERRPDRP